MGLTCLDFGHYGVDQAGILDPGAVGPRGNREADVVTGIGLKLQVMLEAAGERIILTRLQPSLEADNLSWRAAVANTAGADIFVSIHADSFHLPTAQGTTTYFAGPGGQMLAQYIQPAMVAALGRYDRGIRFAGYQVLRETAMPAVLVECAFLSNPEDEEILASEEGQQLEALGLHNGIMAWYGR